VELSPLPKWSVLETIETSTACAGAAASYVLRRIAFRAGAFAPGIDEEVFRELHASDDGRTIDDVERWLAKRTPSLFELGYRLRHRRVIYDATELVMWVNAGRGYRGAVVPDVGGGVVHAVGLAIETEPAGDSKLVVIDPWPCERGAHRDHAREALALHWVGWA
jgi:hypothetical protein